MNVMRLSLQDKAYAWPNFPTCAKM
jgi:hypothetical protein